jgi:hypothetical protein
MGKTRGQIKADIQDNLIDFSLNYYSDDDLNVSVQDAYTDVSIRTQCIQNKVTLNWLSNLSYYNFIKLGVSDYLGCIAIFNNITNLWLRDDLSLKDFDRIRRDWENWTGTPQFWAPSDYQSIAVAAKYIGTFVSGAFDPKSFGNGFNTGSIPSLGTFILYYWALAPTLANDLSTFLIASDMQDLITNYTTADLLEQAQEFGKANEYWELYEEHIQSYADRVKRNTKSDLLLRI